MNRFKSFAKHKALCSVLLASTSAFMFGCGSSSSELSPTAPDVLKFADTGIDGMEEMRRAFHEFVDVMEDISGMPVDFYPVANRTIAAAALAASDVDIVLAGPTEYLFIKSRQPGVVPLAAIERAEYYSVVIVPTDSPAQSLQDLKGKTIAFKDPGSTSGHVVPTAMFLEAGMEAGRDYAGPLVDHLRYEMLYNRDADAMVGGIRDFRRIEDQRPGQYRILAQSAPLPRDIIIARPGLPPELVATLSEQMVTHGERIMQAILAPGERSKYRGAKIVPAEDSDYDQMREIHRLLELPFE